MYRSKLKLLHVVYVIDTERTSTLIQQQETIDDISFRLQDDTRSQVAVDKDNAALLEQQMKSRQSAFFDFSVSLS